MLVPDPILDAMLTQCRGTNVHVCSGQPADFAGITAVELATAVISGSYTLADGSVDGRKQTLPGQADLNIDANGSATHYAVSDGTTTLYEVYDVSNPQTLNAGGTVSVGQGDHTLRDAA